MQAVWRVVTGVGTVVGGVAVALRNGRPEVVREQDRTLESPQVVDGPRSHDHDDTQSGQGQPAEAPTPPDVLHGQDQGGHHDGEDQDLLGACQRQHPTHEAQDGGPSGRRVGPEPVGHQDHDGDAEQQQRLGEDRSFVDPQPRVQGGDAGRDQPDADASDPSSGQSDGPDREGPDGRREGLLCEPAVLAEPGPDRQDQRPGRRMEGVWPRTLSKDRGEPLSPSVEIGLEAVLKAVTGQRAVAALVDNDEPQNEGDGADENQPPSEAIDGRLWRGVCEPQARKGRQRQSVVDLVVPAMRGARRPSRLPRRPLEGEAHDLPKIPATVRSVHRASNGGPTWYSKSTLTSQWCWSALLAGFEASRGEVIVKAHQLAVVSSIPGSSPTSFDEA